MIKIILILSLITTAFGKIKEVTLKQALDSATSNNLELKINDFKIEQATKEIGRIKGEFMPQFESTVGVGPINKVIGDSLESEISYDEWGIIVMAGLDAVWPIYAWGMKKNYLNAAKNGVKVKKEDKKIKREEIRYNVKKAYYGSLYTHSLKRFVDEIIIDVDKALDKMKDKKNKKEEIYQVEILRGEIESKKAEILKNHKLAIAGLGFYMGLNRDQELSTDIDWIEYSSRKLKSAEHYWNTALQMNPELSKIKHGIEAKKNLAIAEKKTNLPVIGLLMAVNLSYTNMREKQKSRFAFDPYNSTNFAFGIGFKWDFNWGVTMSKVEQIKAEELELKATEKYAVSGYWMRIKKICLEIEENQTKFKASKKSYKFGKKWLNKVIAGLSLGLVNAKEIVDAYGARALTQKNYYESIYNLHISWAKLTKAVGVEVDPTLL